MKRTDLIRRLAAIPPLPTPRPDTEQVMTPPEVAADLLLSALARGDLSGRTVLDLGSGTGVLAIGAALCGAARVTGVESDTAALEIARGASTTLQDRVTWVFGDVGLATEAVDTVLMNPPFGAQHRHADRPFWERAFDLARSAVYAFALPDSRTFIARRAVARGARIEETLPVAWRFPRTFPHHRQRSVELAVDRWTLRLGDER